MSIRKVVLNALAKHGQCTYDDLERHTSQPRDKMRIAINDAKKAGHVALKKDDVTGQPAYKITPEGKAWLANFETIGKAVAKIGTVPAQSLEKRAVEIAVKQFNKAEDLRSEQVDTLARITNLEAELADWQRIAATVGAGTPDDLQTHLAFQDGELVDAVRKANEAQEQLAALELEAADKISSAQTEITTPAGYIVASPNKPLRRFHKASSATACGSAYARANGLAEIFAIYPHAKAVRGVEWKPINKPTTTSRSAP